MHLLFKCLCVFLVDVFLFLAFNCVHRDADTKELVYISGRAFTPPSGRWCASGQMFTFMPGSAVSTRSLLPEPVPRNLSEVGMEIRYFISVI